MSNMVADRIRFCPLRWTAAITVPRFGAGHRSGSGPPGREALRAGKTRQDPRAVRGRRKAGPVRGLGFAAALGVATLGSSGLAASFASLELGQTRYAPAEAIQVTLTNLIDAPIACPAAPDACAVVRFEREENGSWTRWSNCERLASARHPLVIDAGESVERALRRDPALRRSGVETYEGRLPQGDEANDGGAKERPPLQLREVEQLTDDTPPAPPFFERLNALPDGRYRLVASCAPAGGADGSREIRSAPFEVGD